MSLSEQIITILCCTAATMATRFLPFIVFSDRKRTPAVIVFLGKWLPSAVFAMLVVYCLRNVDITAASRGIPEFAGVIITAACHLWKKNLMLSMVAGTVIYLIITAFIG